MNATPEILISSIESNRQLLDGGSMFGNAPRPVWEKWIAPDHLGRIPLACRCLLIEFDNLKVLCETGIGAFFEPRLADRFGVQEPHRHILRENLIQHGLQEEDIDYVILSHLHFDHGGGLLPTYQEMQQGRQDLLFPNATYIVGQEAWERAQNPHMRDKASFIPELNQRLETSQRLYIVKDQNVPDKLKNHLSFRISHGHTPGQLHTVFKGKRQTVFFCGDLIPGQAWIHLPITMGYDRNPEQLINEKALLYQDALPNQWLLFLTHDPEITACTLQFSNGKKYSAQETYPNLVKHPI